ncbi:hypothetical protein PR202_gn00284 [Eleusine coracana subsp. coracana]|uniref:Reticulon-like protein n=1 Tax=Eleusine coracana subsp. coracana TaxID=191504 RepID=A0AAV5G0S7_ELECO|nr:hypothetical protein PR202_gn00179 [Eleusine coracana subsp. coracana]GJN40969.1 hypothetical protein PR202_gn00284 [Eleusine coracana subsp. coracana]
MAAAGDGVRWCVVTGGRGFAARHLVTMLLRSGEWRVRVADLPPAIALDRDEEEGILGAALREGRAAYTSADLRDKAQVARAFEGVEVVFHMAAPDSSINSFQLHYSVNVEGTKNVIDACIRCKVKRLIYTSSPSVVFDGVHGIFNADESIPYPDKFNDSYSETKADAEKLVMRANGREGLLTCCIRPSSIFGPGDKLLVPSLVAAAKAGKSKVRIVTDLLQFTMQKSYDMYIIGDGNNYYDFTYVENVAYGHVCAEKTLSSEDGAKVAAGKTYFITNMEPIKFWEFMSLILEGLGYERPSIKIPVSVMMPVAHVVEWTYKKFAKFGHKIEKLEASNFQITEVKAHHMAHSVSSSWNSLVGVLRSLCRGNDWTLFSKVVFFLLVVSILSSMSSQNAFKIGIALIFLGFKAYEKWEDTIDSLVGDACSIILHFGSTKKSSSQKQM